MATPDSQMNQYLNIISTAVKGKDMRSALHDAIEKAYNDAYTWYDSTLGNANQALSNSQQALEIASGLSDDVDEVKDLGLIIEDRYNEIVARIDNIIAHNNDTEGNTELIDIRTTFQGYTATSAGSAVRLQANTLNERMNQIVRTFPTTQVSANVPLTIDATSIWQNSSATSDFAGQTLTFANDELTDCSHLFIKFKSYKSDQSVNECTLLISGSAQNIVAAIGGINGVDLISRSFTISSTTIVISDGTRVKTDNPFTLSTNDLAIVTPATSSETNNSYFIPTEIIAVKLVVNATLNVAKDSEITDARVGVDGTVYNTLGEAIRTQVSQYTAAGIIDALNASY